eukprot:Pgem_evm1s708
MTIEFNYLLLVQSQIEYLVRTMSKTNLSSTTQQIKQLSDQFNNNNNNQNTSVNNHSNNHNGNKNGNDVQAFHLHCLFREVCSSANLGGNKVDNNNNNNNVTVKIGALKAEMKKIFESPLCCSVIQKV